MSLLPAGLPAPGLGESSEELRVAWLWLQLCPEAGVARAAAREDVPRPNVCNICRRRRLSLVAPVASEVSLARSPDRGASKPLIASFRSFTW